MAQNIKIFKIPLKEKNRKNSLVLKKKLIQKCCKN